jgi:hypothetical protein
MSAVCSAGVLFAVDLFLLLLLYPGGISGVASIFVVKYPSLLAAGDPELQCSNLSIVIVILILLPCVCRRVSAVKRDVKRPNGITAVRLIRTNGNKELTESN